MGGLLDIDERLGSPRHVWKLTPVAHHREHGEHEDRTRGVVVMIADGFGMKRFALGSS